MLGSGGWNDPVLDSIQCWIYPGPAGCARGPTAPLAMIIALGMADCSAGDKYVNQIYPLTPRVHAPTTAF